MSERTRKNERKETNTTSPWVRTRRPLRNPDILVREQKLADRGIEREPVHPAPGRIHEHRRRPVDDVAGGDLRRPRLEKVCLGDWLVEVGTTVDRKDRPDRDVHVNV